MSATLSLDLFRPSILDPVEPDRDSRRTPSRAGGGLTLDDLLVGVWEDLSARRAAACPLCDGEMAPRYGAGALPVGGRCRDCATTIA